MLWAKNMGNEFYGPRTFLLGYSCRPAVNHMSASDLFTQANEAFFDDDYDEALSLYTQAIKIEPENPEFYLKR
jgi:hypothetical protein